jgi:hypothetical protein
LSDVFLVIVIFAFYAGVIFVVVIEVGRLAKCGMEGGHKSIGGELQGVVETLYVVLLLKGVAQACEISLLRVN